MQQIAQQAQPGVKTLALVVQQGLAGLNFLLRQGGLAQQLVTGHQLGLPVVEKGLADGRNFGVRLLHPPGLGHHLRLGFAVAKGSKLDVQTHKPFGVVAIFDDAQRSSSTGVGQARLGVGHHQVHRRAALVAGKGQAQLALALAQHGHLIRGPLRQRRIHRAGGHVGGGALAVKLQAGQLGGFEVQAAEQAQLELVAGLHGAAQIGLAGQQHTGQLQVGAGREFAGLDPHARVLHQGLGAG